ncbi:DsbC family protein [Azospira sp. I09]|uniref:DsbC family protein n=1 Tax=Azospira sp. I09 TaxID=1765049 RepID=UPI001260760D|nr:DsbC family protein [Azospira sp. I09]BBN90778.1 thiol:disulfide interchange protein [Azospira sp. I09]
MKTTRLITTILAATLLAGSAYAGDALKEMAVMATLKQKYPSTVIKSVSSTNLPGVYEVVMGKNVAYVEESGRYFLFGHMFDMQTQTDLTEGKIMAEQVAKVDFKKLPLKDAIKIVRGDGSRKVAIFSDPDCPYCKQLENNIANLTNVTIYLYLFPIDQLHPQAKAKSVGVWCAADQVKAWDGLMRRNEVPTGQCENPVDRNIALAEAMGINGTPTVILPDGSIIPGAPSAAKLEQMLNQAAAKVASK